MKNEYINEVQIRKMLIGQSQELEFILSSFKWRMRDTKPRLVFRKI